MKTGADIAPAQTATARSPRWHLSLPQLWAVLAVALPAMVLEGRLSSVDLAYHIRAGESMLRLHSMIRTDTFSFTAGGRPWIDQQWGAQILFAWIHRRGAWAGLGLTKMGLVALIFAFVYLACRASGASARLAAGLALASFVATGLGLPLRPQLLGMALFAACLWLVAGRHDRPARLWVVPALVAIWANVHGSFFLGPAVLALALIEDVSKNRRGTRRDLAALVLSVAAATINPFGVRVWSYAVGLATNPVIRRFISEWQPPSIRTVAGAYFFASGLVAAAVLARTRKPVPAPSLLWLGTFFVAGLFAIRNSLWWALAAPVVLAGVISGHARQAAPRADRPRPLEGPSWLNTVIAGCVVAAALIAVPWWGKDPARPPSSLLSNAPVALTAQVRRLLPPRGRMFNAQAFGSWFEFALPDRPVFVDSRVEVYPTSVWDDYQAVSEGREGWQRILSRWRVSLLVADLVEQRKLISVIRRDPGWKLVYRDEDGLIFERR